MKLSSYPAYRFTGVKYFEEIPEHWKVHELKEICEIRISNVDKKVKDGEQPIRLCNYVDVYKNDSILSNMDFMSATANPDEIERYRLQAGDVLITKDSETWNDIAVPALVEDTADDIVSGYHLALLRSFTKLVDGAYLFRALQSIPVSQQFHVSANGVTRYGLSQSAIRSIRLPLPSLAEQTVIKRFLDQMTAKIDRLVTRKRTLIERLREKRIALISRTITKGIPAKIAPKFNLNPWTNLKPSGIHWLGNVPESWEIKAIKRESIVQRGASPRPIDNELYFDENGEYSWVRIADISAAGMYLHETTQRLSDLGRSFSVPLDPGTVFLSIAGSVGKPCITKIKCCIHDGFVYFPLWRGESRFLYYLFESGEPFKGLGKLGTQLNLNTDTVGSIIVGFPTVTEQCAIADFLDQETSKIDVLISKAQTAIERLQEYRMALVTAAVTGAIDVRGVRADAGKKLN